MMDFNQIHLDLLYISFLLSEFEMASNIFPIFCVPRKANTTHVFSLACRKLRLLPQKIMNIIQGNQGISCSLNECQTTSIILSTNRIPADMYLLNCPDSSIFTLWMVLISITSFILYPIYSLNK
jgi:hypothetical protein